MTDRRFKAGKSSRYTTPPGRLNVNRIAWVRTVVSQFVIQRYDNKDTSEGAPKVEHEVGDSIFLVIPVANRQPVMLNFTAMTEAEFSKTRQLFDLLFRMAEPIVQARDKVAQDAFSEGDDSYSRIYRAVPEFVVREGAVVPDSQSLLDRSASAAGGDGNDVDLSGRAAGRGEQLADGEPQEGSGDDDAPETD